MKKEHLDKELYEKLGINELILFCVRSIIKNKEKCTFQRLVKESFILFPEIFGFPNFSRWPDSRKLDRPLRTLRKRKLITGSPKTFFSLTKSGKRIAEETAKTFRQGKLNL